MLRFNRTIRSMLALAALLLLVACAGQQQRDEREEVLRAFEAELRYGGNFESLINYMHPDYVKDYPISSAELSRLNLFQVSGYRARSVVVSDDGSTLNQVVELKLYHRNTARERTVIYPQLWRLDEERDRWMLHSGLPNVSRN
ncbi:MAG: hypothetical protein MI750_03155 [Xanthomonadales bacterium]|nr:hypothetical protein [Xanthomonadales bacterium]